MNLKSMHRAVLIALLTFPVAAFAGFGIGINVGFAPPPLPVYAQPPCPAPGYIWTPGYWGYDSDDEDYYWVPGTWVMAPSPGLLWTPGYWGTVGDRYEWSDGYWGAQVGFYGGIDYGFGYFGEGFEGGYWRDGDFFYNRSVTNVSNVSITNVYNRTISNNFDANRASFNGRDGVPAAPTRGDLLAARLPHYGATVPQKTLAASALRLPLARASINHGRPPLAATQRPNQFPGSSVTGSNGVLASRALARGNRGQSVPRAEHSFASGRQGMPYPRSSSGQTIEQSAHPNQTPHDYPQQRRSPTPVGYATPSKLREFQAPTGYRAPERSVQAYRAPPTYQASNVQRHQAPNGYQTGRSFQAYPAAPPSYQARNAQMHQGMSSYQTGRNFQAYQPASNYQARNLQARQAPSSYQTGRNFQAYQPASNYQARNVQARQAPSSYQTGRNPQAYQAPGNYQAPRNFQANQAPHTSQTPHR